MAIEIRELHIKAVIDSGKPSGKKGQAPADEGTAATTASAPDQLISLCVEKVLEILKEKSER